MRQLLAAVHLVEDGLDLGLGIVFGIELLDAVVGQAAALLGEELMAAAQGGNHVVEGGDGNAAHLGQLLDVGAEVGRHFDGHGLVGAPGGEHLDFEAALARLDVVFQ